MLFRSQNPGNPPQGFKDGGSVKGDAAFGIYPGVGKRSQKSDIGERLSSALIPQDTLDIATMLAPYGKLGKVVAAAALSGTPMDANAGNIGRLLHLVKKEAPEQLSAIREALIRTFHTGREHSVIGSTEYGGPGVVTRGSIDAVSPNMTDLKVAKRELPFQSAIDFHKIGRAHV